ncbi:MAG: hypothetical protein IT190_09545 [Microbacteriaceae bacterium]|nr:hypothetical protein [Microbacteriaceae bacterium]
MLTRAQKLHNDLLDLEISAANRHNKFNEEIHQMRMKQWAEFRESELKKNPDQWIPLSYPNMDMSAPKHVIGIRYVE